MESSPVPGGTGVGYVVTVNGEQRTSTHSTVTMVHHSGVDTWGVGGGAN